MSDCPAATETLECRPLRGLEPLGGDSWSAIDDDPQFHLTLQAARPAGIYRVVAQLQGAAIVAPSLYFDYGSGWCEESRHALRPAGDGRRWTLLASLPEFGSSLRFDPSERPGDLELAAVTIEQLDAREALLFLLAEQAARDPAGAMVTLRDAHRIALCEGFSAATHALMAPAQARRPVGRYAGWLARHHVGPTLGAEAWNRMVDALPARPLFSLVVPLEATRGNACLDAVFAQVYPDWELLLVPRAEDAGASAGELARWKARSSRVRVIETTDREQGLSTALKVATGRFVALLAGDCRLAPHALLAFADASLRSPEAKVLYCDGDRLDGAGVRHDPDLKPGWDPTLLESQDYLRDVAFFETGLVRSSGGIDSRDAATAHHELALRCSAFLEPEQVVHVPLLLCSVADESDGAGPAAACGGGEVLAGHFARTGVEAHVAPTTGGYRIQRQLPDPPPRVALVVPTRDRLDLLRRCVDSILQLSTYPDFEILVVDNQSQQPETLAYFAEIDQDPRVRILRYDLPFNYSAINNFAVGETAAEVIGLVNNDIEVIDAGWIEELVQHALRPHVGAVGAMLYYPDDTIQHAGVVIGLGGVAGHVHANKPRGHAGPRGRALLARETSAVTGACLFLRRDRFLEVGGLDEGLAIAFNDVDLCLRLVAAGYRNVFTPFARLYHHESASRGIEDTPEKRARFESEVSFMHDRWGTALVSDPLYNPNLSLDWGAALELSQAPRSTPAHWLAAFTNRWMPPVAAAGRT